MEGRGDLDSTAVFRCIVVPKQHLGAVTVGLSQGDCGGDSSAMQLWSSQLSQSLCLHVGILVMNVSSVPGAETRGCVTALPAGHWALGGRLENWEPPVLSW